MKTTNTLLLLSVFATTLSFTAPAQAAAPDCNVIESLGNILSDNIQQKMNSQVAGDSYRINRRKRLNIHGVNEVNFHGCTVRTSMKVTLKRKIRRDAHGNVGIKANVASFNGNQVCLSNVKVTDVNLSRTLGIGENIYKLAANKAIKIISVFL